MSLNPVLHDSDRPLVSVIVHNYNYGRYLRQCLDSVFTQTYPNVEICFSDNSSADDSWEIALDYSRRYPGVMNVTCNRMNFGSDANHLNCRINVRGKYLVTLCSDDAMAQTFVEKCVAALEIHRQCGYAMVHRSIIDAKDRLQEEAPFYSESCIIPGAKQASVYMMAAVNPSISQVMYNRAKTVEKSHVGGIAAQWYGARLLDFKMCCEYDMAYIKEPLLLHRLHGENDSSEAAEKLLEVIGPYVLQHQFAEIAATNALPEVAARLPQALDKLGNLCLRYCVRFLLAGNERLARRYFHLAPAISPDLETDPAHRELQSFWNSRGTEREQILAHLRKADNLASRTHSYPPPEGSRLIDWDTILLPARRP